MNVVVLTGRLTKDVEMRNTPAGALVANFDIAVDRPTGQGKEKETDFIKIIAWQKTAELCSKYLSKGLLVGVEGRLQIRDYEAQDGQKRKVAEVVANNVQFLERKGE